MFSCVLFCNIYIYIYIYNFNFSRSFFISYVIYIFWILLHLVQIFNSAAFLQYKLLYINTWSKYIWSVLFHKHIYYYFVLNVLKCSFDKLILVFVTIEVAVARHPITAIAFLGKFNNSRYKVTWCNTTIC